MHVGENEASWPNGNLKSSALFYEPSVEYEISRDVSDVKRTEQFPC